ncbi:MAG: aminodeoxychorismate lyase [Thiopseudomonas sp.]|nr:aminodeoxychorismate lyase [Thiopseudomonas sp.]
MTCWVNGQPAVGLALTDRGLAYGDGLFETMRVTDGQINWLELHLQRLQSGCQRLRIDLDMTQMRHELLAFAAQQGQGVCKLILTRGDGQRGYGLPQPTYPRRILQAAPLPLWPAQHAEQGVRLFPCQTRLAIQPLLAGLKHLNRLEQVMARAEWNDSEHAEGLLLDTEGRIIECVFSNIFFVRQGCLLTPELSGSGVAGIMRERIMQLARELGIAVQIRDILPDALAGMDELFTCNSLYGIWPVREYRGQQWLPGPLTRKLQHILDR